MTLDRVSTRIRHPHFSCHSIAKSLPSITNLTNILLSVPEISCPPLYSTPFAPPLSRRKTRGRPNLFSTRRTAKRWDGSRLPTIHQNSGSRIIGGRRYWRISSLKYRSGWESLTFRTNWSDARGCLGATPLPDS